MVVRFKPKFWRDINKVKKEREVVATLGKIIKQTEKSKTTHEIANFKQLTKYKTRCRIKLKLDKKRDFRIGLYVRGNTVWFTRFLHRRKIYEENW